MTVVVIDNSDSFTYILADYVARLGERPVVLHNSVPLRRVLRERPTRVVLSPGPGDAADPTSCGVGYDLLRHAMGRWPVLGVCLGHQALGVHLGAGLARSAVVRHGRISTVERLGRSRLLRGLPARFPVMRYHSLVVDPATLPASLRATAVSPDDGALMAVEHVEMPVFGVQFHPESVGTRHGMRVLSNFLRTRAPHTSASDRSDHAQ